MKKLFCFSMNVSRLYAVYAIFIFSVSTTYAFVEDTKLVEGRWDLVVSYEGKNIPSWLEVQHSGNHTLVGRFCYAFGSARPVAHVRVTDGKYSFSIPPQWEPGDKYMEFEFTSDGTTLTGTMVYTDGKKYNWTGVRAPSLRRTAEPSWGKPINLITGNDTKGWHADGTNQWTVKDGILSSAKSGANLITDQTFNDFKLHVEFRCPKGSNSGVYLRGRYEAQIEDSKGKDPSVGFLGAIYGFLTPSEMVAKDAGEWQTLDITLVGRMITLAVNGKTVITNQEIPGITGGALDSKEGEPGPLMLQGDHGPIEYRNIVVTPAK
jgi:hypothetical protein